MSRIVPCGQSGRGTDGETDMTKLNSHFSQIWERI